MRRAEREARSVGIKCTYLCVSGKLERRKPLRRKIKLKWLVKKKKSGHTSSNKSGNQNNVFQDRDQYHKCLVWQHLNMFVVLQISIICSAAALKLRFSGYGFLPKMYCFGLLYTPQKLWLNYVTSCMMIRLLPPKEHSVLQLQNSVEPMWEASTVRLHHTLQISILNFRCSYVKVRKNVAGGIQYTCIHIKILLQQTADRQTVL